MEVVMQEYLPLIAFVVIFYSFLGGIWLLTGWMMKNPKNPVAIKIATVSQKKHEKFMKDNTLFAFAYRTTMKVVSKK